jgi:hypothetical protein
MLTNLLVQKAVTNILAIKKAAHLFWTAHSINNNITSSNFAQMWHK